MQFLYFLAECQDSVLILDEFSSPDKVIDVPAVFVVLVTQVQVVEKTVETPHLLSDVQVPHVQVVERTVQIPQLQFVEKIVAEIRTAPGTQTSESLNGKFAGYDEKSELDALAVGAVSAAAAQQQQATNAKSTRERVKEE